MTEISKQRESADGEDDYYDDIVQPIAAQGGDAYGAPAPSYAEEAYEGSTFAQADISPQAKQKVATKNNLGSAPRRPAASGPLEIRRPKVDLRNYFPETWLFNLVELDSNGETTLPLEAPHTITTWVAETVCTDTINGAQVSEEANLLVTQDFFADLNMPYSIKRGEKFPLNVSVFNTIEHKLPTLP